MAFDADFQTVSGTKLFVAAGRPATDTAAGYAALIWVEVGVITAVGDVLGATSNTATLANISDSTNLAKKASSTRTQADFQTAWVESDAGQALVRTYGHPKNYSTNSYKLEKQDHALRYFTAQAMSVTETGGAIDDAVVFGFSLLRQSDTITVPAPA